MRKFCWFVNKSNDILGALSAILFIPLVIIVSYEVISRYLFNRPTIWAWDILIQLAAAIAALGAGYALARGEHVIIDTLVIHFSRRVRAVLGLITGLVFFAAVGVLAWYSSTYTIWSVQTREGWTSVWQPPFYPIRVVITIGIFFLALQGVVKFINDINIIRGTASVIPYAETTKTKEVSE